MDRQGDNGHAASPMMIMATYGAELSSSNVVQTRHLWGPATDQILARTNVAGGGTAYWYFTDNQGSVRDVVASSGSATSVLDHVEYDAFGVITLETSPSYGGNVKWTGVWRDPGTGLQYNQARWYDPATHRWLTQDPLADAGGSSNWYEYTKNDPLNMTDSSGLRPQPDGPVRIIRSPGKETPHFILPLSYFENPLFDPNHGPFTPEEMDQLRFYLLTGRFPQRKSCRRLIQYRRKGLSYHLEQQ